MATSRDKTQGNAKSEDTVVPAHVSASGLPRLDPGAVIAHRYRVVRYLARGGMGEVYEAEDLELGERVALKTIRADSSDAANEERFKREIQLSRKVTHPNVCRIFDVGYDDLANGERLVFLTMELIIGETLLERVRRDGPLPLEDAERVTRQIVGALGAAHAVGVVHRNLKSGNVLLSTRKDGSLRAAVADFGLAHGLAAGTDRGRSLSGSGGIVGTPGYMAPEQVEDGDVSARTDVYALGVVMFEMVTGRLPFEGPTPLSIATKRLTTPPPSPRRLRPELPIQWDRAMLACMEREPGRRPARARDVLALLEEPAVTSVALERIRRRAPYSRPLFAFVILAVAAILAIRIWRGNGSALADDLITRGVDFGSFEPRVSEPLTGYGTLLRNALRSDLLFELPVVQSRIELRSPDGHEIVLGYARPRLHGREPLRIEGSFELSGDPSEQQIEVTLRVIDPTTNEQRVQIVESGRVNDIETLVTHLGDRLRAVARLPGTKRRALSPAGRAAMDQATDAMQRMDLVAALEIVEQALSVERGSVELGFLMSRVLGRLQLDVNSAAAIERTSALGTDDPFLQRRIEAFSVWRDPSRAAHILEALHAERPDDVDLGLELAMKLAQAQRTEDAKGVIAALGTRVTKPVDQMRVQLVDLGIAERQDRMRDVVAAYPALLTRARTEGYPGIEVAILTVACTCESRRGNNIVAQRVCEELAHAGERISQPAALVTGAVDGLGVRSAVDESPSFYAESIRTLQFARQLGSRLMAADALSVYGMVVLDLRVPGADVSILKEALELARAAHEHLVVVDTLFNLAYYASRDGKMSDAISYLRQVVELSVDNGAPLFRYDALCRLGTAQLDGGDAVDAQRALDDALQSTKTKPDDDDLDCPVLAASLAAEQGRTEESAKIFRQLDQQSQRIGSTASARMYLWDECLVHYDGLRFVDAVECTQRLETRARTDGVPAARSSKLMRAIALAELGNLKDAHALAATLDLGRRLPGDALLDRFLSLTLERELTASAPALDASFTQLIAEANANGNVLLSLRAQAQQAALMMRDSRPAGLARARELRDDAKRRGLITITTQAQRLLGGH